MKNNITHVQWRMHGYGQWTIDIELNNDKTVKIFSTDSMLKDEFDVLETTKEKYKLIAERLDYKIEELI